jgi:tetratricopeptide (TPR) repeat protein
MSVQIHWEGESKDCGPWARPSRAELEDFLTFAQEALSVPIGSVQLNARRALALWKYDFDEEAAAVCSTAKSDPGADRHWPLLLLRARIHQDADEYADALECIHTMMASNELSEDSDEAFTRSYWSEVLFIQGQHHRSLKQFDEAAECFLGFLQYIAKHERFQRSQCSSAVLELFKTWTEAEKYALIVDHVKQWKLDQTDDNAQEAGLDWFRILAPMTKFHSYLLLAVARTSTYEVIGALYDDAIERLIDDEGDEDSRRFADMLSFHRAYIFLYCSPSISEQDRGLNTLVQRILRPDDSEDWTTAALTAVSHATRALLTRGIALHKQLKETASPHHQRSELETNLATIVTQLTTIATHSSPLLTACRRSPDTDPNLHLARLHLKLGDETASREIIRDLLEEQFDDWPGLHGLGGLSDRYNNLAVILAAVDEDSNAVDAWRLMSLPGYSDGGDETSEDGSSSSRSGNSRIGSSSGTTRENFDEIPLTTDAHSDRKDNDKDDEEEIIPSDAVLSTSPQPAEDAPTSTTTLTAAAESKTSPPELVFGRERTFSCDGACGAIRNPLPEEFHVCRICPDVQFCTPCHAKLLKGVLKGGGTLPAIFCRPDHGFLYIPPLDRTAWAEIGSEAMLLYGRDNEIISREAWLEQLRAQWGSLR